LRSPGAPEMTGFALVQYQTHDARTSVGIVAGDTLYDVGSNLAGVPIAGLADVYDRWDAVLPALRATSRVTGIPLGSVTLLPPAQRPSGIYCAGVNYQDHVDNVYRRQGIPLEPSLLERGLPPWHFLKAGNTLRGNGASIELATGMIDWEIELAAVIGRTARNVAVEDALAHVAGYTVAIDLSARDRIMREAMPLGSPFRYDWIAQKSFEASCPLGPWLIPADDIGDPQHLALRLSINGAVRQDADTSLMIYSTAAQIAHLSTLNTLAPGDIILTGTPAGTGIETGTFLKRGDVVTAWIERIGELTVTMT
jgi:2-keto-4-pentenoate hydratase/2-oxohepta-3-ene-1,7-dioic acid hydratase in catechol pathway